MSPQAPGGMIAPVPYLIDGNNLMHALVNTGAPVGRTGLCELLKRLVRSGERVRVVFDGPPPSERSVPPLEQSGLAADFSASRSADEVIIEYINGDSAPRRLTVVSTDRGIRKAARRRRCKSVTSEEFVDTLHRVVEKQNRTGGRSAEPSEKRHGLTEEQTRYWLKEFEIDQ